MHIFSLCGWLLVNKVAHTLAGRHMHINELKAAKAAKAAIEALLTATRSAMLATLRTANYVAAVNLSGGGTLNEARDNVGIALSNLLHDHGPPAPERIDKAKRAIEAWIKELEASAASSTSIK
jgi:hypothetical protein